MGPAIGKSQARIGRSDGTGGVESDFLQAFGYLVLSEVANEDVLEIEVIFGGVV